MSSIVTAITGGGGSGMGFKAKDASIVDPTTQAQLDQAGVNTQGGLDQQNAFVKAIQAQNGLGNQSSVFNQLQGVANGTGPNPAQAQLAQATGANTANQAALMASQRGSGANTGLLARQAAMQGANTQQQAAGQGATLQAQQSLSAMGQLGGIAGQQVGQQAQATNAYTSNALAGQQNVLGAKSNYNNAQVSNTASQNTSNGRLAEGVVGSQANLIGNLAGVAGEALLLADGGIIENFKHAFDPAPPKTNNNPPPPPDPEKAKALAKGMGYAEGGPVSSVGRHFHGVKAPAPKAMLAEGGKVPAMVSPGETYLRPNQVEQVKKGANPLAIGERIPGKPKVKGNSYANDVVPKTLDEGGVVIPNSIMQSKDASKKAAAFVAAVLKKQSLKRG